MLELFGFAWVTITFTFCVAAVSTRRSVLRWMKARTDRKRLDDTVEIVRRPMRKVATYAALVVLALPAGVLAGGSALPGPLSAAFTGGTVANAVVLTGDNSGGVGTLRIRPADEDTQLVLCEASNNSSPEMCTSFNHSNATATSFMQIMTNGYTDSASANQRFNTSAGTASIYTQASTTNASNVIGQYLYSTNNTVSGSSLFAVTGAGTSTYTIGQHGTVTTDIRGPILNGGSATCNGILAGYLCHNDDAHFYSAAGLVSTQATATSAIAGFMAYNTSGSQTSIFGYGNSAVTDTDYQSRTLVRSISFPISINRSDDTAAGSVHTEFRDNSGGTGVVLMDLLGDGTVRPLLYGSQSNCSDGAGAAACTAAPAGSVVIDDGATTVVVSTTAVTANSQITPVFDSSLGTKLGVTCNTTYTAPYISARTAATSFTITAPDPAGANPACFSYTILN